MKVIRVALMCIGLLSQTACAVHRVSVLVLGEEDKPLPNEQVVLFAKNNSKRGWGTGRSTRAFAKTDEEGRATLVASGDGRGFTVTVYAPGYYEGGATYNDSYPASYFNENHRRGLTGHDITIRLLAVRDPVPMYCGRVEAVFPAEVGKGPIGYDLTVGDWVKPYGNGAISQLVFEEIEHTPRKAYPSRYREGLLDYNFDYSLIMRAGAKGGGFLAHTTKTDTPTIYSSYWWPYEAPFEGYQPEQTWRQTSLGTGPYGDQQVTTRSDLADFRGTPGLIARVPLALDGLAFGVARLTDFGYASYIRKDDDGKEQMFRQIQFAYMLNAVPGSRSLEHNGENLLMKINPKVGDRAPSGPFGSKPSDIPHQEADE